VSDSSYIVVVLTEIVVIYCECDWL